MAKANIQTAMAMLDPDRCAQAYELPSIMARESFRLQQDRVSDFDSMADIVRHYYIAPKGQRDWKARSDDRIVGSTRIGSEV